MNFTPILNNEVLDCLNSLNFGVKGLWWLRDIKETLENLLLKQDFK